MSIFVDTSALLAVLAADDLNHAAARQAWERLVSEDADLVVTNYVLVETFALVQSRLGMPAVRLLQDDILPVLRIESTPRRTSAASPRC